MTASPHEARCQLASPFFNERPVGACPSLVVLHFISLPPGQFGGDDVQALFMGTLDITRDPFYASLSGLEVSSHFFIRRDGVVMNFVPVSKRAWHAGRSVFEGRENVNDFSIGIELEGDEHTPFTHEQYEALSALLRDLQRDWGVEVITGHEFVAPGRKIDPGPQFDWARLREAIGPTWRVVTTAQHFP